MAKPIYLRLDTISGAITDKQGREYSAEDAAALWASGGVYNYNTPFMRLIGNRFDLAATLQHYAAMRAAHQMAARN